jgi:phosphate transport system substrate-binding protein
MTVMTWMRSIVSVTAVLAAALTGGCANGGSPGGESSREPTLVRIDGSSTVFPISEAVAEEFAREHPNVRPTVATSGTGGGFQKFCRGEIDINDASRPIKPVEIKACAGAGIEFIELPVAYDGLAVVVHPKNSWATSITVDELRRLWEPGAQNRIMRWNQIRSSWPDREIRLFGAGVDSGTYDYFTEAIVGTEGSSRGDFTSSEDDNVLVQGIAGDEGALGFMGLAYVEGNKDRLKLVGVDDGKAGNGSGPILPSVETVRNGTYQPLSRPLFIYVAARSAERPEVRAFVNSYFDAPQLIREVGYIELPAEIYELAKKHFAGGKRGTAFGQGGSQVGMTLEQLFARER